MAALYRPIVIGFGRFNPPTTGHAEHIEFIRHQAERLRADHRVYASVSHDAKKNPLPFDEKVHFLEQLFPHARFSRNASVRTPFDAFLECSAAGYTDLFVVVSGERVPEFQRFAKYFAKPGTREYQKDKSIPMSYTVVDSGRSMNSNRVSGTQQRKYATDGNYAAFRKNVPTTNETVAKNLYRSVRMHMGLHEMFNLTAGQFAINLFEAKDATTTSVVRCAECGEILTPKERQKASGTCDMCDLDHRNKMDRARMYEDHIKVGDRVHAGFGVRGGAGFRGVVDKIEDNKVYVNVGKEKWGDRIIVAPLKNVMKEAVHATFGQKMRGATILYQSLTGEHRVPSHLQDSPEALVNAALQVFADPFGKRLTPEGWKIAGQMIAKMDELGIKWNRAVLRPMTLRALGLSSLHEAEVSAPKEPTEADRLRTKQQQELITLKQRQANDMMAAKLRDVQQKSREQQQKLNAPKPAAKPAS